MKSKVLVLGLVFSLLVCSGNVVAKERRGAEVVIQKIDGQTVVGELMAVKSTSLVLLDSRTGADVSVGVGQIAVIKIIKKPKTLLGVGAGVAAGSIACLILYDTEHGVDVGSVVESCLILSIPAVLLGVGIAAILAKDEKIQFEGMPEETIRRALDYLRAKARITEFQQYAN